MLGKALVLAIEEMTPALQEKVKLAGSELVNIRPIGYFFFRNKIETALRRSGHVSKAD